MLPSLFFMLPVVVVDVAGDRLDHERTRKAIAQELAVEAVAPDDPRAAEGTGRIEVVSKDGKLTVRYRKVDAPIERSIAAASDPARAELDAAYLAGNLARDESAELARDAKPATAPAAPSQPPVPPIDESARDLVQMRVFLKESAAEEKSGRVRAGVAQIVASAAFIAPATYLWTLNDVSSEARYFRLSASVFGGILLFSGIGSLVASSGDMEDIAKELRDAEAKGGTAGETIAAVEKKWARRAETTRGARIVTGYLNVVIGALGVGLGGTALALDPRDGHTSAIGVVSVSTGALMILQGATSLVTENGVETSWRLWKTAKQSPAGSGPRVSFGGAPLAGGGMASLTLSF